MAITRQRSGLRILAGCAVLSLVCTIQSASAHEARKRIADANALAPRNAPARSKAGQAKGPYYVDFRARTAASWGHAFVWYGKTSERAVEVAGLTPAGDTLTYMLGHVIPVPSETGASYGDLDPEYLTASYRVYLNEADAKRVFAYIRKLQDSSPVWNAETMNCTGFIGNIAEFMGLKVPMRWQRPEEYVSKLKEMNAGRQMVQLAPEQ
ncbi:MULTISPECIES: hypothetical protein [unclassified Bradyrhizobium]|uniref:hypothetical protein n=1 Tax=unclassified Bradyrhizobium TaxID=2631580 RepID=UPI0004013C46|nr:MULTISPECIES: hypothetical protein [unclassified Bradyrhizobium]MCP3467903.1 hypothetical protein [Bradyrhizobium sp. CCGUVB23]